MSVSTVKVAGHGVVQGQPDEVEFQLSVTYLTLSPEDALAEVVQRSKEVELLFDQLGVESKRWSTTGVSVNVERDYVSGKYIDRGYRATNTITLRLEDASIAGKLIGDATTLSHVRVDGPWWRIALDNPARTEACRQAALEARRKAEAYAEALGSRLGPVLSVIEPGLEREDRYGRIEHSQVLYSAGPSDEDSLNIQAGELDISAEVVVTFALENSI